MIDVSIREERDRLSAALQARGDAALTGAERDRAHKLVDQYNYQLRQQRKLADELDARARRRR